mgnify:CR=1 FL=1
MPRGMGTYGSMVGRPKKKKKMRDGGILDLNKDGKVSKAEEKRIMDAITKRKPLTGGPVQNLPLPPNFKDDKNVGDPLLPKKRKEEIAKPMRDGGKMLKDVPKGNKGLGKLPKSVRNKMGFKRDGGMMSKKRDMMYGGGMMSRKRKMMGGGTVNQQSVNENINPYGRPADTSLT